ncbi:hypothetical protein Tco_0525353 [Tanacetum coccineum]
MHNNTVIVGQQLQGIVPPNACNEAVRVLIFQQWSLHSCYQPEDSQKFLWQNISRDTAINVGKPSRVATMQVNVQFLQQLQPEWSRFVTIVKQQHKLDEVSYHKLFDILKQYQKEVNELRAERMAKNAITQ